MKQLSHAIVLLGKEPIPGKVKTRLAIDTGPECAAVIQEQLALHILQRLRSLAYPIILQLQGSTSSRFAQSCLDIGIVVELQANGTLTEKIHHASQRAERSLVLGLDMPLIDLDEVDAAMKASSIVIGPAIDGGYWLIGGSNLPIDVLTNIPWSTEAVFQTTVEKCTNLGLEYKVLSRQQDIDTLSDLQTLLSNPQCPASLRTSLVHTLNTFLP